MALWLAIWSLEVAPPASPFLAPALAVAVMVCGWRTLERGLGPWALSLRANRDTLPAVAAMSAFCLSALSTILEASGRLPAALQRADGARLTFYDSAAVIVVFALLMRPFGARLPLSGEANPSLSSNTVPCGFLLLGAVTFGILTASVGDLEFSVHGALAVLVVGAPFFREDLHPLIEKAARGRLRRSGIRLPPTTTVRRIEKLTHVLLRKGDVLTTGLPEVVGVTPLVEDRQVEDIVRLSAAAQFGVPHRLGQAILRHHASMLTTIPRVKGHQYLPGRGVQALLQGTELHCGNLRLLEDAGFPATRLKDLRARAAPARARGETVIFVALAREVVGMVTLRDRLRPDSGAVFDALRRQGLRVGILSGDDRETVRALCRNLGALDVHGDLSPDEYAAIVSRLVREGKNVGVIATASRRNAGALSAATVALEWPPGHSPGEEIEEHSHDTVRLPSRDLRGLVALEEAVEIYRAGRCRTGAHAVLYHSVATPVVAGALWPVCGLAPSILLAATAHFVTVCWSFRKLQPGAVRETLYRGRIAGDLAE